jgi:hypothetical protein
MVTMHRPLLHTVLVVSLTVPGAAALGAGTTITGVVTRPARIAAPEARHLGFLPPLENPIVELRQYDPFPEMFVFLEGGPLDADATAKTAVVWQLETHSFSPALLPVMSGASVEIANVGRETHLLASEGSELVGKDPIGPGSSRSFEAPAPGGAMRVVSRASPHIEGRLVPLPSRLYSRIDRNGKFKIDNVPAGRWTVRIWYRDGWANVQARTIDVPGKDVRIDLTNEALAPAAPEPK